MLYAVMLFDTGINLGMSTKPMELINYHTSTFNNGALALTYYAETPCYWSYIVEAETEDELANKHAEAIENHQNTEWVTKNVLPYI